MEGGVSEDAARLQSEAGKTDWYRSELTEKVSALQMKSAPAQGWKDTLKGMVQKGQIKQAEIDAVGLTNFLDLKTGKVTKEQVTQFLRENGVRVEETTLGGQAPAFKYLPEADKDAARTIINKYGYLGFDTATQAIYAYAENPSSWDMEDADKTELNRVRNWILLLAVPSNSPNTNSPAARTTGSCC